MSPPETTELEARLLALIKANGPISLADYMADALGHPHDGYYATQSSLGADGDFTTAPEISQVFGELIGLHLVQSWIDMGEPEAFNLVELGPGRGVMMADVLRAARVRPGFLKAARLTLVEASGRLRHEQQKRLRALNVDADWKDAFTDVPEGPLLLVANEFFDCLPIRQYERTELGWRERLVGAREDGAALAFTVASAPPAADAGLPPADDHPLGAIFETGEAAAALGADIAARLVAAPPGRALIIDYGRVRADVGDTLQAVRDHAYWPVLTAPGRADLTAYVDFDGIARAAIAAGAGVHGPVSQGLFLERLGLAARLEKLCAGKSPAEQAAVHAGAHRLAAPSAMGEIFKAMAISSPTLPAPAGF
ncbi:MAG: SAM-dependent methyltransferase [Pseudomonadota bacterium]